MSQQNIVLRCNQCAGELKREPNGVVCLSCDYREGIIDYANRLGVERRRLAKKPDPKMSKRAPKKRQTKVDRVRARLDQLPLDGPVIRPGSAYRSAEAKVAERRAQATPAPIVRGLGPIRCPECDRTLIATQGHAVCPGCGQIDETKKAIATIMSAFPGTEIAS